MRRRYEGVIMAAGKYVPPLSRRREEASTVAEVELAEDTLSIHVLGMDRLWALRSRLEIPLSHVSGAEADPEVARRWWQGIRSGGTHVPGVITAGTLHQEGERGFLGGDEPE